jgi:hypothetical protein
MSIEQTVLEKLRSLPPERQQEVLDFTDSLLRRCNSVSARRSLKGAFAHLGIHLTAEDIDEARREMWSNFPRGSI